MASMLTNDMDDSGDPDPGEEIQISFLYMGQGDCILVSCPDGKRILVDCGSAGNFLADSQMRAHLALRGEAGVTKTMTLHALILTHPDLDHYNQVPAMLREMIPTEDVTIDGKVLKAGQSTGAIAVDTVYFSYNWNGSGGPLMYHTENGANNALYHDLSVKAMKQVFLRGKSDDGMRVWKPPFKTPEAKLEPIDNDRIVVAEGTTAVGKKKWSVSIIAGNVAKGEYDPSDTDGKNASSLVTLVKIGEERALLTGDSTFSTERFLIANRAAEIGGVYLAQAPHHGSATTSSSPEFVKAVSPKAVAVSVQYWETKHRLPDRPAIDRWLAKVDTEDSPVILDSWERVDKAKKGYSNAVDVRLQAWNNAKPPVTYRVEEGRYIREFDAQTFADDYVLLWPFEAYMLYRQRTTRAIRTTGAHGWDEPLWYALTGT